jgi:hypothetical protein
MLESMKKRPIEIVFRGPVENRRKAVEALKGMRFVEATDSRPWREAFPELTDEQLPGVSLKGARIKEGLTQKKLAVMTGIRQHHISEMENYKRAIGRKNAIKFAKALKTSHKIYL